MSFQWAKGIFVINTAEKLDKQLLLTLLEFLTIRKCLHKAVFTQEKLDWQEFLSRVTTWPLVSNVTTPTRVDEYSSPPRGWFRTKMTSCSLFTQYHIYEILHCSKIAIWLNLCWHNIFFGGMFKTNTGLPEGPVLNSKKYKSCWLVPCKHPLTWLSAWV